MLSWIFLDVGNEFLAVILGLFMCFLLADLALEFLIFLEFSVLLSTDMLEKREKISKDCLKILRIN